MHNSYHDLLLLNAPLERVRDAIAEWLAQSKFEIQGESTVARMLAVYRGWHGYGITDKQTGSILELLLESKEAFTAVSFHHHTTRFLFIVGLVFGDRLSREVKSLIRHLKDRCDNGMPSA